MVDEKGRKIAIDCALFGYEKTAQTLQVLLMAADQHPSKQRWLLPGGFLQPLEDCTSAAARVLEEETGISDVYLEQLFTFSEPSRDPRGPSISVAYYGLIPYEASRELSPGKDSLGLGWFSIEELPALLFDHKEILSTAIQRLRNKIAYAPLGFELLPETFTMAQLQRFHETILGRTIERRKFRRRIMDLKIIEDTGEKERDVSHRPATLYRLHQDTYKTLLQEGYPFEF